MVGGLFVLSFNIAMQQTYDWSEQQRQFLTTEELFGSRRMLWESAGFQVSGILA
jgi:hypothetical protein